ncbi:MAG: alkaline phosphatase family protein [Ferruginibacter sp.]
MKTLLSVLSLIISISAFSQQTLNIFIITTDGFRWKEVFFGADSLIINDPRFVKDIALSKELFWEEKMEERRKKLMPFFWNTVARSGQLYGNRQLKNRVNNKNLYRISYPGYNEIFTGYADPFVIKNSPVNNKNINILEYLNALPAYNGKVVAFTSWDIFPFIFNKKRNSLNINSSYILTGSDDSSTIINKVQNSIINKTGTRHDLLTFVSAKDYIQSNHPRVVMISLGETDEFAHQGRYDLYLQQANSVDRMIAELWYFVQTDSFYKDQTTFIITTDHGRGARHTNWTTHNMIAKGSGDAWLALLGNGIEPLGEMRSAEKLYLNQVAATVAALLG